ncbi:MAG: hypothetical protein ABI353_17490 [Isosphaeraceae bacterium]
MFTIGTTQRLVTAYAESEPWKTEHDRAMQCQDLEEAMIWGSRLFRAVVEVDEWNQARAIRGEPGPGNVIQDQIEKSYQILALACDRVLKSADALTAHRFAVEGLEEFRLLVEEAWCMAAGFEIEAEMRPIEELLPLAKGCPRPERYGESPSPNTP